MSPKKHKRATAIKILSTHGSVSSTFPSTDLRNLEAKIAPGWYADIYFRGHSSKLGMVPMPFNDVTTRGEPKVISKTKWLVNVGGFMGDYAMGDESYVERNNLPPVARGWAIVKFRTKQESEGGKFHSWNVEIQPLLRSPVTIGNNTD